MRVRCQILSLLAASFAFLALARDANDALRTAYRGDVIGPELWTSGACGFSSGQPCRTQTDPRPGLSGLIHVVHNAFSDALVPTLTCDGKTLTFRLVGNDWRPAGLYSIYRADPSGLVDEPGLLGDTVYSERKCITTDNVFIAEGTLRNAGAVVRKYAVDFNLAPTLSRKPGRFTFATTMRSKREERSVFAAPVLPVREVTLPPNAEVTFRYALALSPDSVERAAALAAQAAAAKDPFADNVRAYNDWMMRNTPRLTIDDESLRKLYDYRWFLVWRSIHRARRLLPDHPYPRTAVYESPMGGWYGCVIGLPVPVQLQELAWMRDPSVARDHIRNWCDGVIGYRDYIQFTAMSVWRFLQNHSDRAFAKSVCLEIRRDAECRAGKGGSLPVQCSSWPTGAEYQPNFYQFTEPKWDFRHDVELGRPAGLELARLVRLDTAVFAAASLRGASEVVRFAGEAAAAEDLRRRSEELLGLIRAKHWDERLGLFLAADPASGHLADEAACYDSFVPYMFGLIGESRYFRAFDKLCSSDWFWDRAAVTTVAKNCPMYAGGNFLRGPLEGVASPSKPHRYGCCWNGPAWHYADTLVAEAFGQVARRDPARRGQWLSFFRNWTETHFPGGDRSTPRAAEHFRPEDGVRIGSTYDYFHSAWLDAFYRYFCGLSVRDDLSEVCFEPFGDVDFVLSGVPLAGRILGFVKSGTRLKILDEKGMVLVQGTDLVCLKLKGGKDDR